MGRFEKISEISLDENKNVIISLNSMDKSITIVQEKVFESQEGTQHVYMKNALSLSIDKAIKLKEELDKAIKYSQTQEK